MPKDATFHPLLAAKEIARQVENSETEIMVTMGVKRIYRKIAEFPAASWLKKLIVCRLRRVLPLPKRILFTFLKAGERATIPEDDVHTPLERLLRCSGGFDPPGIDPRHEIAALLYTGGTTGPAWE